MDRKAIGKVNNSHWHYNACVYCMERFDLASMTYPGTGGIPNLQAVSSHHYVQVAKLSLNHRCDVVNIGSAFWKLYEGLAQPTELWATQGKADDLYLHNTWTKQNSQYAQYKDYNLATWDMHAPSISLRTNRGALLPPGCHPAGLRRNCWDVCILKFELGPSLML